MHHSLHWSAERSPPRWWPALWAAGAVLGVAAESSLYGLSDAGDWVPDLLTGWTLIGCGLIAWMRRPEYGAGALLTAAGCAWFVPNFATVGAGSIAWLCAHATYLYRGPLTQLVLTFPRQRPAGRVENAAVGAGWALAVITPVWRNGVATVVLAGLMTGVAAHGYMRASGPARRMRASGVRATVLFAIVLAATAWARLVLSGNTADVVTLRAFEAAVCTLSLGLLVGVLRAPWERSEVTDLIVEIGERRTGGVRDALARALGDASLEIGYRLPETGRFVDADGRELDLPAASSQRSTTTLEWGGEPVAVLVHDPSVLGDPGLLDGVATAASLAAANARLQAAVRAQLAELIASRRRIIEAGDEERARLERRLHAGAKARLDRLALTLRTARGTASSVDTVDRIAQAAAKLERTQDALRRLARGIHPLELSEHGLADALEALAAESPVPVQLSLPTAEITATVAVTVYYVCSEALANVVKYASASNVRIVVRSGRDAVSVEVQDDGVGGAAPSRGTGLRGLADRVAALGGVLAVDGPPGHGTRVTAVIPLTAGD